MQDFGTRKPEKPKVPMRLRISQMASRLRGQFTTKQSRIRLALTIVALSGAIVLLIPDYEGYEGPDLFSSVGDDDFPQGLLGNPHGVPQYKAHSGDSRECDYAFEGHYGLCYYAVTEAEDDLFLALIVEDIARDYNSNSATDQDWSSHEVLWVTFYSPEPNTQVVGEAYAFRSDAIAQEVLYEEQRRSATVIDGVYVLK